MTTELRRYGHTQTLSHKTHRSLRADGFIVGFARRALRSEYASTTYTLEVVAMGTYPHFNPTKYNVQAKIAVVRSGSHSKHNINYHIVWIPKYRKHLLVGKVRDVLLDILRGKCEQYGWELLAVEVMPDHIHLFIGATPTDTPATIVKTLKGNTAVQLRRCFPDLKHLGYQTRKVFAALWARGYYIGSAGHVSQESVKRYIEEQQGKDVFEYSIYGDHSGQSKIGNFTQAKLDGWTA